MINLKSIRYLIFLFTVLQFAFSSCAQIKSRTNAKPLIVFVTGDHEYGGESTLMVVAGELEKNYGFRTKVLKASPDHNSEENIPGLEVLKEADIVVFYLRWRRLPASQIKHIDDYLRSGKPLIGFRTTTHAFNYPKGHELERWNAFGEFALNAPPGWGGKAGHTHYGHESSTDVSVIPEAAKNSILTGVSKNFHARSWLYKVLPDYPLKGSEWLLMGHAVNPNNTKAIDNPVAWTGINSFGAKVFTTTLGHPEDFDLEPFQRLVINAIHWASGKPVPRKWAGKFSVNIPYRVPVR
ncbi:ThuA domain-containing protein [Daejeonella sp.]|uniref:ThuA domain-containing protein n=1 Tax=Daejeonella sp. TaxID=2805397 RepID=UPI00398354F9